MQTNQREDILVWWLNENDTTRLLHIFQILPVTEGSFIPPEYIKDQIDLRRGRSGRGRLWVHNVIGDASVSWDETKPLAKQAGECGGIVFFKKDFASLKRFLSEKLGFVTDMNLDVWDK